MTLVLLILGILLGSGLLTIVVCVILALLHPPREYRGDADSVTSREEDRR